MTPDETNTPEGRADGAPSESLAASSVGSGALLGGVVVCGADVVPESSPHIRKAPWTKRDARRLQRLTREMIAIYGESQFRQMAYEVEKRHSASPNRRG